MSAKSREQKVRRSLYKMGYLLRKSRVKNINLDNFGDYMVLDFNHCVVCGPRFDYNLGDVVSFFELDA